MRKDRKYLASMSRLVAFGCSQTYGHGLPDCINPNETDCLPSAFAWPALLNGENLAEPGGSNKLAVYRALNYSWQPNDIAVFAWTYHNRSCIIGKNPRNLGTWPSVDPVVKSWRHFVAVTNDPQNFYWDTRLYVDYIKLKLPVRSLHFTVDTGMQEFEWDGPCFDTLKVDTADDNLHYGIKTHRAIADLVDQAILSN